MRVPRSKLYVHCGLHKTGTTAIQYFCSEHSGYLMENNIAYPKSGRQVAWGHHNIAFELTKDRRFLRDCGDFKTICEEIGDFKGDILLSSEAFQYGINKPECFLPLIEFAKRTDREVIFIIYLRNQYDCLLSVYLETLQHGYGCEFKVALNSVLSTGLIQFNEQNYQFDYSFIIRQFRLLKNAALIIRNYNNLEGDSSTLDLLSLLKIKAPNSEAVMHRLNYRNPLEASLGFFYKARMNRPLNDGENAVIEDLGKLNGTIALSDRVADALAARFYRSNRKLPWRHSEIVAFQNFLSRRLNKTAKTIAFDMEKVFSFETQCMICEFALKRGQHSDQAMAQKAALQMWEMSK